MGLLEEKFSSLLGAYRKNEPQIKAARLEKHEAADEKRLAKKIAQEKHAAMIRAANISHDERYSRNPWFRITQYN